MLNRVSAVVRAYDPCLSCSTHADRGFSGGGGGGGGRGRGRSGGGGRY
jgi:hypothetical protein